MKNGFSGYRVLIYLLVVLGLIPAGLFGYWFVYRYPVWTLRAFKIPSKSSCPTICEGERILVQMRYGSAYVPARGDVVIFEYGPSRVMYIKRVIGLPGDAIKWGPNNAILVNGQRWTAPTACAKSPAPPDAGPDSSSLFAFKETQVPAGQVFVIGDNLNNSFDSRIDGFEPVVTNQVRGRPVMIYWSPKLSRIGCQIR